MPAELVQRDDDGVELFWAIVGVTLLICLLTYLVFR